MAELEAPPSTIRSQKVNEFLGKTSMPALVQNALAKAQADQVMRDTTALDEEEQISAPDKETELKLQQLSRQTGLSIDTLRMIKKVETKVVEHKLEAKRTIDAQMDRQTLQTMTSLAN